MQILVISRKFKKSAAGKIEEDHSFFALLAHLDGFIDNRADGMSGFGRRNNNLARANWIAASKTTKRAGNSRKHPGIIGVKGLGAQVTAESKQAP